MNKVIIAASSAATILPVKAQIFSRYTRGALIGCTVLHESSVTDSHDRATLSSTWAAIALFVS